MTFYSKIKVMNNSTLGYDEIEVSTICMSSIDLSIPTKDGKVLIELDRKSLIEFLLRTQPTLVFNDLAVSAMGGKKAA